MPVPRPHAATLAQARRAANEAPRRAHSTDDAARVGELETLLSRIEGALAARGAWRSPPDSDAAALAAVVRAADKKAAAKQRATPRPPAGGSDSVPASPGAAWLKGAWERSVGAVGAAMRVLAADAPADAPAGAHELASVCALDAPHDGRREMREIDALRAQGARLHAAAVRSQRAVRAHVTALAEARADMATRSLRIDVAGANADADADVGPPAPRTPMRMPPRAPAPIAHQATPARLCAPSDARGRPGSPCAPQAQIVPGEALPPPLPETPAAREPPPRQSPWPSAVASLERRLDALDRDAPRGDGEGGMQC